MYDNISLYLDSSEVNDINLLNEVLKNGDDINDISKRLGINIQNAKLCRIDKAQNFNVFGVFK